MVVGISVVHPSTSVSFVRVIQPTILLRVYLSATIISKTKVGTWAPSKKAVLSRTSDGSGQNRTSTLFKVLKS
jgi:hypothetical protein